MTTEEFLQTLEKHKDLLTDSLHKDLREKADGLNELQKKLIVEELQSRQKQMDRVSDKENEFMNTLSRILENIHAAKQAFEEKKRIIQKSREENIQKDETDKAESLLDNL